MTKLKFWGMIIAATGIYCDMYFRTCDRRIQRRQRIERSLLRIIITVLTILPGIAFSAAAEQLTINYSFAPPHMREIIIEGELYHTLSMPETPNGGGIGQPALPARGAYILLPQGAEVADIQVVHDAKIQVPGSWRVEPIQKPVPLSLAATTTDVFVRDDALYNSSLPFPETRYKKVGVFDLRGYRILVLKLYPVEYVPATGALYYFPNLTVTVQTRETGRPAPLFRGLPDDRAEICGRVDNPDIIETYESSFSRPAGTFDLLILTTPELAGAFQPLKDYHDTTGVPTEIYTTADISTTNPDLIRLFLRERYLNDGIQYLLIGADDDVIPAKDLYVISWEGIVHDDPTIYEYEMPGDIYYACLDGGFNYDGDAYWGEPTDGDGGGDVDLLAELYVGRATADDSAEAAQFVNKTIAYLTSRNSYLYNALNSGEFLGYGGDVEYAKIYMQEFIDSSSNHGYHTVGIPSDAFILDELYDLDWPTYSWPSSEIISRINNGVHFINHLGHCNETIALKNHLTSLSQLTNENYCFIYTQGCFAGRFDGLDCWAEYVTGKNDHGAFAVAMNARYGFGSSRTTLQTTDSPSQRFAREFWDAVFNPAENKPELGRANQDSKEDNLYRIDEPAMRWVYYQMNIFGDPSIPLRTQFCDCAGFCDVNDDGNINPVDVVLVVNFVYKNQDARTPSPSLCPGENGDWNCNGAINPVDVVFYVNYVYKASGLGPCDPCNP